MKPRLSTILLAGILVAGCRGSDPETAGLSPRPEEPLPIAVEKDVPYCSDFVLDVYYPNAPGPWPVAVVFHGGEETRQHISGFARPVAEGGVVVFVPDYSSTPDALADGFRPAVEDAACAMRFARAHASEFEGNAGRIVAAGHSFGGAVAALMVVAGDAFQRDDCLSTPEFSAAADGLVGLDGAYDLVELPAEVGFRDWYTVEQLQEASATEYIEPAAEGDDTGFVLFTGREAAAQHQARLFHDALTAAGYRVDSVHLPDAGHGAFASGAPGTVDALVDMAFAETE
jgi:acetyl esterase/lipase